MLTASTLHSRKSTLTTENTEERKKLYSFAQFFLLKRRMMIELNNLVLLWHFSLFLVPRRQKSNKKYDAKKRAQMFDYKVYIIIYYDKPIIVYDINSYLTTLCAFFRSIPKLAEFLPLSRFARSNSYILYVCVCHRFVVIAVVFYSRELDSSHSVQLKFRSADAVHVLYARLRLNNIAWSCVIRLLQWMTTAGSERVEKKSIFFLLGKMPTLHFKYL